MVSERLPVIAAGAVLLLAFSPPARAASAGGTDSACDRAVAAADGAEHDYEALKRGIERQIADGGHPGTAELQALQDAGAQRVSTASQVRRVCGA
ncbi:hypothetical protein GCM10010260_01460 [Streptomyces filipinensis]|uniref:Secreted protein n=1 Tax=Streptomyces filipinensis TaxID=66887 RepID=A0A918M8I4_9ACTN|nr:hypothetical protein [Streptomyces filipinensis]GGU73444.1 hypothetical protein GCM10010260_01460 [Streptomyces filipinensis]